MGAFAERYSSTQRAVLFREVIDEGRGIKATLKAARAGELDGLTPVSGAELGSMAYGYACQLVRQERENRGTVAAVKRDGQSTVRDLTARLLKRAEHEVARIEKDTKSPMDTGATLAVLRVLKDARALLDDKPKPTKAEAPEEPKRPRTLAERIATQDTAPPDSPYTQGDNGDHAT